MMKLFRLGLSTMRNTQHNRILQNNFKFYFCTQSIDQLRNKLTELNTQFYEIKEYEQKEKIMNQVIDVKTQLNKLIFPNGTIEKYQGYRRDLLMLAQLSFENDNREECNRLLSQIMQGDFKNEFGDHKDENQGFLSGLYIIHCLTNLEKLAVAEESAVEALQYLDYFVENRCPIYQSSIKEEKPTAETLLEEELQSIQNLVSHLLLLSKICSERGKVSESVEFLGIAATHLDNMGHLFRKVFSKQIEVKTELKEDELKKFFMNILINEAITLKNLSKSCIQLKRFEDADNLIQAALTYFDYLIEQKLLPNHDENYISTLITKYQLLNLSKGSQEDMTAVKDKLDGIAKQLKETDETLFTLVRYELFLNEYFNKDTAKVDELMSKINYNVPVQLEFNQLRIQNLLAKNKNQKAIELCKKQLDLLKENFDQSHYLFEETLQTLLELSIAEKDLSLAKECLVQLSTGQHLFLHIQDFDQLLKFQRLRIEFYDRVATSSPTQKLIETIEKLDAIAFSTLYHTFKKAMTVAQFYETLGNKELQKIKYQECLKVLTMDQSIPNNDQLAKNIQEKLSKIN